MVLVIFVLALFLGSKVQAATTTTKPVFVPEKAVLVADVNIRDAKIISQEGNKFKIAFNLLNGEGVQSGVKYGVSLIAVKSKTLKYLVDEKVYDESLTLNANTKLHKEIEYTAPSSMSGEYKIILSAKNESGFPFSMINVGDVKLVSTTYGVIILPETCYVKVANDTSDKTYRLGQGVDIKKEENIKLTCAVQNLSKEVVTATPIYETRYRSNYGEIVNQTGGDTTPITLKALEKKNLSFVLSKATAPQAYSVKFVLNNNGVLSNSVSVHYVLRGTSATIQNLSLDKDYYKKGDVAKVSFFFSPSADSFPGSRLGTLENQKIISEVKMLNGKGKKCADVFTKVLDANTPPKVDFPISITSSCFDPKIIITAKDENGTVLDQKEFNVKTTSRKPSNNSILYVIIFVVIVALVYFFIKKRKGANTLHPITPSNPSVPMSVLFFLFLASLAFIPTNSAKAATFSVGTMAGDTVIFAVDLDQSEYDIGELVSMSATMSMAACGNEPVDASLDGEINQSSTNIISASGFGSASMASSFDKFIWGSADLPAPSQTGTFSATFTGNTSSAQGTASGSASISFKVIPPPTVTISASKNTMVVGDSVNISWTSVNAVSCSCSYEDGDCGSSTVNNTPQSASGNPYTLSQTKTFSVTCTNK